MFSPLLYLLSYLTVPFGLITISNPGNGSSLNSR